MTPTITNNPLHNSLQNRGKLSTATIPLMKSTKEETSMVISSSNMRRRKGTRSTTIEREGHLGIATVMRGNSSSRTCTLIKVRSKDLCREALLRNWLLIREIISSKSSMRQKTTSNSWVRVHLTSLHSSVAANSNTRLPRKCPLNSHNNNYTWVLNCNNRSFSWWTQTVLTSWV